MAVHCQLDLYFLLGSWWFTIISHIIFIVINFHHHCSYWSRKVKILWNTLGTFGCSFAHLPVCPFVWGFFWNQSIKFSDFLHEHRMAKSNFWKKKILFWGFVVFQVLWKINMWNFSIFFAWGCSNRPKETQNELKEWGFTYFFLFFFCIKLQ